MRFGHGGTGMVFAALKGWTPVQRHVVAASYLGWTLDAFDYLLITFVAKDIAAEFGVSAKAIGPAALLTLGLRPLGAFIFGRLADRYGRRPILMLDVLLYSGLAFASAFAPNITVFLILRCLFGIAMGGEWGIGASLTMEHVKPESRGFVSGLLQTGYPTGSLIAAVASGLLVPHFGWRALVMASAIPALLVLYIRRTVPESPAWTEGQKSGARKEAGKTMAVIRAHWKVAIFAVILMSGFNLLSHGTQDFYPNFLRIQHGFSAGMTGVLGTVAAFGAILGGLIAGTLSQRFGRRRTISISALCMIPVIPFWVFLFDQPLYLALSVFVLQFCVQGAWGVVPAHLNELSPPHARGTFPGFVYQLGNLAAAGIGLLQASLVEDWHWTYAQALAADALFACVLVGVLINFGPEARHVDMREMARLH